MSRQESLAPGSSRDAGICLSCKGAELAETPPTVAKSQSRSGSAAASLSLITAVAVCTLLVIVFAALFKTPSNSAFTSGEEYRNLRRHLSRDICGFSESARAKAG